MSARRRPPQQSSNNPNTINENNKKKKEEDNKEVTEKILLKDEDFTLRATVRKEPRRDREGNILDKEGNINKSRGKVGIMTNNNVNKETGKPLGVEDIKAQQARAKEDQNTKIRIQQEQQKMLRYEMQGRLSEYKAPSEFADSPLLQHPSQQVNKPTTEKVKEAGNGETKVNNENRVTDNQ